MGVFSMDHCHVYHSVARSPSFNVHLDLSVALRLCSLPKVLLSWHDVIMVATELLQKLTGESF